MRYAQVASRQDTQTNVKHTRRQDAFATPLLSQLRTSDTSVAF